MTSLRPRVRAALAACTLLALFGCDAAPDALSVREAAPSEAPPLAALVGSEAPTLNASPGCTSGTQPSGATYVLCMPEVWNGSVVLYAHGYQRPQGPPSISDEVAELAPLANSLGFAFAASSYRKSGLAVLEGVDDTVELAGIVETELSELGGIPGAILLTGASEGGLVTALALERHPDIFSGGLPTCGPCGDFRAQINYLGDARVLFDYFFPGLLPGSVVQVPQTLIDGWNETYKPAVLAALAARPTTTAEYIQVARIPVDASDPESVLSTIIDVLEYNVFATNDARTTLGGNPYSNRRRWYTGSKNDWRLNLRVARYRADAAALEAIEAYQTSGRLDRPIVSLHTTGDAEVPFWHQPLYRLKAYGAGSWRQFSALPIERFGHCTFTNDELIAGLGLLVLKVAGQSLASVQEAMPSEEARLALRQLAETDAREQRVQPQALQVPLE